MKHLKIEDQKAYFKRGESWIAVSEMNKEDLLNLAHAAVEEENLEMDAFEEAALPNPAHKIIYQRVSSQLNELHSRRADFLEEVRNVYKEAYNKYCTE